LLFICLLFFPRILERLEELAGTKVPNYSCLQHRDLDCVLIEDCSFAPLKLSPSRRQYHRFLLYAYCFRSRGRATPWLPLYIPHIDPDTRDDMRVACLQFAPEVGKVQENIARADNILSGTQLPSDIDWLVLPELAFTGKHLRAREAAVRPGG
jgi:hypothetical protein